MNARARIRETVSVVLPYYNRADTVAEAALSVLGQTHEDLVLYLIDDGSTDESGAVVRGIDDRRVVHVDLKQNQGVSRARNIGLGIAKTPLLAFMDSDDVWLPEKLDIQLRCLLDAQRSDRHIAVVGCGWRPYGSGSSLKEFLPGPHSRIDVLRDRVAGIGTPMVLVDRSTAVGGARFDESLPALVDRDYVMSCVANGTRILVVPQTLVLVRRRRSDHLATSRRAAAAYEGLSRKYACELANSPGLAAWYSFRAAREHLVHRDIRHARRHLQTALAEQRGRRALHLLLGLLGGRKGLSLAQRLRRLR